MKRKNDPFSGIKITPQSGKQSFVFDYRPSIKIRFTLNPTTSAGYLARGTIGLLDPQTGHLLQTHTNSKERRFSDAATLELYVPYPRPGETQEQIIHRTVMKRTEDLLKRYRHVLNTSFREGKSLDEISLSTAVELYAADYVNGQSSSAEIRKTYYNQLRKLAISFESKKLKDLTSKDFKDFCDAHQRKNGLEYIKRLCHFLMTVSQREGVECPAKKKLEEYIRRQERDTDATNRRLQREAATTDVLPAEYEAALDDRCWRELGQPMEALSVLLKESGLSAKEVCALQWGDLLLDDADHERVFVRYRRDDLASYTHNYTFPLSPYGALYVNAWRAYLEKKCPAERLADSAYIVSQDELGQKAFASGELITYIRTTVSAYTIGYAGRIKLEGMASALGVQLFRNTRRNHLIEDCGLRDDPGALAFLMHQSMTGQVQSDSYRSFTDTTGQQYLYSKFRRDRHGCPTPEKENTRTSIVLLPDGRQEIRIPPVSGSSRQGDALITLVLTNVQPEDVIEVHALGGCFLNVSSERQL